MFRKLALAYLLSSISQGVNAAQPELAADPDLALVTAHCTACHSANLVTQNRMNRQGWKKTIKWMQKDHGLWDLGEAEPRVLDYLVRHYNIPTQLGSRRRALDQPPLASAR